MHISMTYAQSKLLSSWDQNKPVTYSKSVVLSNMENYRDINRGDIRAYCDYGIFLVGVVNSIDRPFVYVTVIKKLYGPDFQSAETYYLHQAKLGKNLTDLSNFKYHLDKITMLHKIRNINFNSWITYQFQDSLDYFGLEILNTITRAPRSIGSD